MKGRPRQVRQNLLLVYETTRRFNGANIHKGRALVATYQNAIERATDARCVDKQEARAFIARVEDEMRSFL